jgi:hypothetical protein
MKTDFMPSAGLILALLTVPVGALACFGGIPPQNPDSIYIIHDDGTVTDTRSGLMWKRCSEGQTLAGNTCTGTVARQNWANTLAGAEASSFAGYTDWRLPNVKELGSLVETCRANPSINISVFPNTPLTPNPAFWTSSPTANLEGSAWFIGFDVGYALRSLRGGQAMARLVRDAH